MNDQPLEAQATALYRLFAADGELLYLGITHDPKERCAYHSHTKTWWHLVTRRVVEWYGSREEAVDAEKTATAAERPRFDSAARFGGDWTKVPRRSNYIPEGLDELEATIRGRVVDRVYAAGRPLPPSTRMSTELGHSIPSIRDVLYRLMQEGLLERRGSRYWMPPASTNAG